MKKVRGDINNVLNLVISGIPSILNVALLFLYMDLRFKPCYKWNTFNTKVEKIKKYLSEVLNLVISGIPSIHMIYYNSRLYVLSFKPCYKWNTFNTV